MPFHGSEDYPAPSGGSDYEEPALRVARGAQLLDQHKPGWFTVVDASRIDIDSTTRCVIAQLYGGDFSRGLRDIEDRVGRTISLTRYGFAARMKPTTARAASWRLDSEETRKAWAAEIDARRSGDIRPRLGFWRGLLRVLTR